jgi:hypothetical protein
LERERERRERKKCGGSVSHYRGVGGGTEFIIGFEGSQTFFVCPSGKCKHLSDNIEVFASGRGGGRMLTGCVSAKNF